MAGQSFRLRRHQHRWRSHSAARAKIPALADPIRHVLFAVVFCAFDYICRIVAVGGLALSLSLVVDGIHWIGRRLCDDDAGGSNLAGAAGATHLWRRHRTHLLLVTLLLDGCW